MAMMWHASGGAGRGAAHGHWRDVDPAVGAEVSLPLWRTQSGTWQCGGHKNNLEWLQGDDGGSRSSAGFLQGNQGGSAAWKNHSQGYADALGRGPLLRSQPRPEAEKKRLGPGVRPKAGARRKTQLRRVDEDADDCRQQAVSGWKLRCLYRKARTTSITTTAVVHQ